jgi:hypothetical protein
MTALTGWLVVLYGMIAAISGIAPAWHYVAEPARAHASVIEFESLVSFGQWLRSVHHFSAHGAIVLLVAHFVAVLAWKCERFEEPGRWVSGVVGLGLVIALAFSGRVLPWDQHAGVSLTVAISLLGPELADPLMEQLSSNAGLARMLWLHLAATIAVVWIASVHVEGRKGLQRLRETPGISKVGAASIVVLLVVSVAFRAPLGAAFRNAWDAGQISSEWYVRWVELIAARSGWLARWGVFCVCALALSTPWWARRWGIARARAVWWALLSMIGIMTFLPIR